MKTIITITSAAALAICGYASAQTAYTKPVGYVSLGDTTSGQPAVKANTDVMISVPLLRPAVYAGKVGSVSGSVITLSVNPSFQSNTFASTTTPHIVILESGNASGLTALVSANSANTVTVLLQPGDSTASITAGDSISIRPAWTVKSIFEGNTIPASTLVNVWGDKIGINQTPDATYRFTGVFWQNVTTGLSADDTVIYHNEGIRLRSPRLTEITNLIVSGDVPTSNSRALITKPTTSQQDNLLGFISPLDTTLAESGLSSIAVLGDLLMVWNNNITGINKTPSTTLRFTSSGWQNVSTGIFVSNSFVFKSCNGYRYRRAAAAPVGSNITSFTPSYVSTL